MRTIFVFGILIVTQYGHAQTPDKIKLGTVANLWPQGAQRVTYRNMDFAIQGHGFFMTEGKGGTACFTRYGSFYLDTNGRLKNRRTGGTLMTIVDGTRLAPLHLVDKLGDAELKSIRVDLDGNIKGIVTESDSTVDLGKISLALFQNPRMLARQNGHCLVPTKESGEPYLDYANVDMRGQIYHQTLEQIDELYAYAFDTRRKNNEPRVRCQSGQCRQ